MADIGWIGVALHVLLAIAVFGLVSSRDLDE